MLTDTGNISICQKAKDVFPNAISESRVDQKYKTAVQQAYNKLPQKSSKETLISNTNTELLNSRTEENLNQAENIALTLTLDIEISLRSEIDNLKKEFTRPTLNDSTSFSATDVSPDAAYHGVETLFSYIRLIHCSAKRSLKNSKSDPDFDGAIFARGWSFDPNNSLAIIEQQSVSPNGLNSMVQYPYDSNYSALTTKLSAFQAKYDLKNDRIISEIKSILKTGHLLEGVPIPESFARFLFTLTYHLFGTEVERHPAAAIHNIMALDLANNNSIDTSWITKLPMSIEGAVEVVRGLQITLRQELDITYYYDHNTNGSCGPDTEPFQKFVHKEIDVAYQWLRNKDVSSYLSSQEALTALDNLCMEYYNISLVGSTEQHGGEI